MHDVEWPEGYVLPLANASTASVERLLKVTNLSNPEGSFSGLHSKSAGRATVGDDTQFVSCSWRSMATTSDSWRRTVAACRG